MENKKVLNDNELENVSGGIELEGFGKVSENDYDIYYKKDGEEPVKPTDAGEYKIVWFWEEQFLWKKIKSPN